MKREQEEVVRVFRDTYDPNGKEAIVIYGTGINAEAVLTNCKDYPVAGVMDVARTGELFCGFRIMSLDEVSERKISKIVVVARPSVHSIIYKRIRRWCEDNDITVLDIYGNHIAEKMKSREEDLPYFQVSYDDLKKEIDCHDVISFDVFDTLLMRKVYEPADVFVLIDRQLSDRFPFVFSEERRAAEHELRKTCEPTIDQIYDCLAEKNCLSESEKQYLFALELEQEKRVLCVREQMKLCMEYCIRQEKKVYLVSDMYLPKELMEGLLGEFDLTGYTELLVSCDYFTSKPKGLFDILREKAGRERYLHIGDHKEADYDSPRRYGMDAFLIMPSVRMMECSAYRDVLVYLKSISSRVMLGMLAADVFRNPFSLVGTKGIPMIMNAEQFGYAFIAPLVLSFTVWLIHRVNTKKDAVILFSARDGWLVQKVFRRLADAWELTELPKDIYLMVSRKALEIVENGKDETARKGYLNYVKALGIDKYDQIYYFDFMSRGTCQSLLEKIIGHKMKGIYFQKSVSGIAAKDAIEVEAYFEESSALEKDLRIFALCDFLECIFTSYHPSFCKIDGEGRYIYESEKRTDSQMKILKEIHSGVLNYCSDFVRIVSKLPEDMPLNQYSDDVLRYTASEYSRIIIPGLDEFMLDDWLGGDKNTGRDALM
ncbi:MAG: hypothetical protein HFG89_01100 [Dorea sp.]|jgi:FMN phosphatase YigB (HAD superfamily)|nr:hypothetical protein [Dorea sp.]